MRRFLTFTVLAAALAVGASVPAFASHGGDAHPACADITDGSGSYDAATATLFFQVTTAERTCGPVILVVWDDSTMTGEPIVVARTARGDATTEFIVDLSADNDGIVCVAAYTRVDRAPDSGCVEVTDFPAGFEFN